MRLQTFQSETVLNILKKGIVYKAKPSISFKRDYAALIEILGLKCKCPIFTVVKGRKQNTSGRVSGAIRLELDVPDEKIKFTEFSVWADFMYGIKNSKKHNYKIIATTSLGEVSQASHNLCLEKLQKQLPVKEYKYPQAILEEIRPEWLVSYQRQRGRNKTIDFLEKIANVFRR